jgi:hypothetical protein
MSQEALEREIAEMRQQIAELKAEAERADSENKEAGQSWTIPSRDSVF